MKKFGFLFLVVLLFSACKPKEEKFFSVIIPTYNRETFLPKAIDSVLSQDYNNYEIIVIDDGSTDNTVKLMNDYLAKDKRIKFLINDENKGVSYSRNRGINEAKGEFVTFLDSDDIFLEGFFNEMNKAIHDNPDAVFFTTWGKMFNGTKEIDFVCDKDGKRIYVQVCYLLSSEKTEEREFGAYENIKDNYPKYVISMDEFDMSRNGIIHMNIRDFLLNFQNK